MPSLDDLRKRSWKKWTPKKI